MAYKFRMFRPGKIYIPYTYTLYLFTPYASSLYCPVRNSDQMTIKKTHPTLLVDLILISSRDMILKFNFAWYDQHYNSYII